MKSYLLKFLLNIYPPYWGTGITVKKISPNYREVIIQMKQKWYNGNYVKTHFGGSLYSMTDPFFMLMMMNILGSGYIVWDKSATINFVKPGTGTVTANFLITDEHVKTVLKNTANGQKYFQEFEVHIKNDKNELVALVTKVLYIRKKASNPQFVPKTFL